MAKTSTSIRVDEGLWTEWQIFVLKKTGKGRKASDEIENALREYMNNHKKGEK